MVNIIKQCWKGEASLATAFWMTHVILGILLIIIMDFVVDFFVSGSFTPFYIHNKFTDMIITLVFPYLFFSAMCVWVCGKNSRLIWNILSKIMVIIPLVYSTFHISRLF